MGAEIDLLRVWANAGSVATPSNAKIDLGWVTGEQPAVEWENERMGTRDSKMNEVLAYLNDGVPLSDLQQDGSDVIRLIGINQASQVDVNGSFSETLVTDVYKTGNEARGLYFYRTTIGSVVTRKQTIAIDVSGSTWSLIRTMTASSGGDMYIHRITSAIDFKIGGIPGANTRVIDAMLYNGNEGHKSTYIYSDYVPASDAVQIDQLDVTTNSAIPPAFDTLIVEVADVTSSTTPV